MPPNTRVNTNCPKDATKAHPMPDTVKKTEAINIVIFLP